MPIPTVVNATPASPTHNSNLGLREVTCHHRITAAESCEMLTHVEFRSDRFPPLENEEKLVNPHLWGRRLADFLRIGLQEQGIATKEPFAEDWGWVVPVVNQAFRLWIGCGHYQEYDDGFLCFIEPHKVFTRKLFKKIDTKERIAELQRAMDKILSEDAGIRAKRWWTYEEFNDRHSSPDI